MNDGLSLKRNRAYLDGPSMQIEKMFGLFLQTAANLVPAKVGADVCNREAISNQESIEFQAVIKCFRNLYDNVFSFCNLGFLNLCQLIVIEDDDSDCWLELLFDKFEPLVDFCLGNRKITC